MVVRMNTLDDEARNALELCRSELTWDAGIERLTDLARRGHVFAVERYFEATQLGGAQTWSYDEAPEFFLPQLVKQGGPVGAKALECLARMAADPDCGNERVALQLLADEDGHEEARECLKRLAEARDGAVRGHARMLLGLPDDAPEAEQPEKSDETVDAEESSEYAYGDEPSGGKETIADVALKAEQSDVEAINRLCRAAFTRGDGDVIKRARNVVRDLAEAGHGAALAALIAWCESDSSAREIVENLAKRGNAEALYCLGERSYSPPLVGRTSFENWRKAAEAGHQGALARLRAAATDGQYRQVWRGRRGWIPELTQEEVRQALAELEGLQKLMEQAERGGADAWHELGKRFEKGKEAPKDPVRAAFWHRRAAEAGHEKAAEALRKLNPFTDADFAPIPAGSFLMGGEDGGLPLHKVTLTRPFYMGKCPVTQAQWKAVMGKNPSSYKKNAYAVDRVSWYDAQAFIRKLNAIAGHTRYRLPTDAEWEYACRAASTTKYFFGDDEAKLADYAWVGPEDGPVGQKKPNAWGLHDLYGSVREWVSDLSEEFSFRDEMPDTQDPTGPVEGEAVRRVLRGGLGSHSASRGSEYPQPYPATYLCGIGFRLAMDPEE